MQSERAALSETLFADFTLVRFLTGVNPSMFDQILPRAERFAAEFANFRLFAGVYPHVYLHVLPSDQFAAHLARNLTLARVSPHVLSVAVAVKRLEVAYLALERLSHLGFAVNLHVTSEINPIAERLVADLADVRLLGGVHAHVILQSRSQVEAFVADLAELREFFVVSPYVDLEKILRRQLRTANVTNVRRFVQRFVHLQVSSLLEAFVTFVTLDGTRRRLFVLARLISFGFFLLLRLLTPFRCFILFRFFIRRTSSHNLRDCILTFLLRNRVLQNRIFARRDAMFHQQKFRRKCLFARVALVFWFRLTQRFAGS